VQIWTRALNRAAIMRPALFSVAAAATLVVSQSANSTARIDIEFDGGANCLPGCSGSSGPIEFGASAVSNHQGLVVDSDSGSTDFVVTNSGNQLADLNFSFAFITGWHLDDPAAEGDRATYSLAVDDSLSGSLFSISQTWTCGLFTGGDPCSDLFNDTLAFDILIGAGTTRDIHVSFSAEADASSVPEPASIMLLTTGLLGLAGARTRRRDRSAASP
jgi:PEP-CTERM motif